jgi:hypothetical protein
MDSIKIDSYGYNRIIIDVIMVAEKVIYRKNCPVL